MSSNHKNPSKVQFNRIMLTTLKCEVIHKMEIKQCNLLHLELLLNSILLSLSTYTYTNTYV
ncbi:hypothetical protein CDL12_23372 [Handroanthus impetiginosus]|uniref:Uncharacterized protein n=1 Tax=Handroanthus impetiginosus TaxID=429701 RepID=A0A2G9GFM8_9LAMI|nr:hypothetical protein CDL12_23372 [Handroanthus impetiginosus]